MTKYFTLVLTLQLNRPSDSHRPVILANAGIQYFQGFFWIPDLRSAVAGMTSLVAGLIIGTSLGIQIGLFLFMKSEIYTRLFTVLFSA